MFLPCTNVFVRRLFNSRVSGSLAKYHWSCFLNPTPAPTRYEAYENYVSTSVSTSLTSIKGVLGAVKTRAKSAVGLGAGPAPIAVEPDPLYEAEVARIEELVAPVAG